QHAGAFQSEAHFSFDQVYLDPQRRSTTLARDAAQLLAELDAGGAGQDGSSSGDPLLLDRRFDDIARSEVSALFGGRFAATLNDLTVGRWQGPIESGYGVHLIRVRRYIPARVPTLDEVRDAVRLECINAERQRTRQRFYDGLLARYAVTVEPPNAAAQGELASAQ